MTISSKKEILFVPKSEIEPEFEKAISLRDDDARKVAKIFADKGKFLPRQQVEAEPAYIQALPVVIVRNKSGDILRLRRKESKPNALHEKLVIWSGGHVREEDGLNGKAILRGAVRELQEELRLSIEEDELKLLGTVFVQDGGKTGQHLAIVFEWRADTDDVAVALSNAEFFERRGNSLSGRFVPISNLIDDAKKAPAEVEPWSMEILQSLLGQKNQFQKLF